MITNETPQNTQMIIFSPVVAPACFGRFHMTVLIYMSFYILLQGILNICAQILTLILIINIPHDVWIVYNIFINNYTLDECTHCCITYSVTAHPDDGQARPKHVAATN